MSEASITTPTKPGQEIASELLPHVYAELRRLAAQRLSGEIHEDSLQPTALVHEAWLRLSGERNRLWQDPQHFLAAAAETMRRILVDRARRRLALKRGSGVRPLDIAGMNLSVPTEDESVIVMSEVLDRFQAVDPRRAELVKLRYFGGLTFEEASAVLGVSLPTAKRWWAYSRAWLLTELMRQTR